MAGVSDIELKIAKEELLSDMPAYKGKRSKRGLGLLMLKRKHSPKGKNNGVHY